MRRGLIPIWIRGAVSPVRAGAEPIRRDGRSRARRVFS